VLRTAAVVERAVGFSVANHERTRHVVVVVASRQEAVDFVVDFFSGLEANAASPVDDEGKEGFAAAAVRRRRPLLLQPFQEIEIRPCVGLDVSAPRVFRFDIGRQVAGIGVQHDVVQHRCRQNAVVFDHDFTSEIIAVLSEHFHAKRGPLLQQFREALGMGSGVSTDVQNVFGFPRILLREFLCLCFEHPGQKLAGVALVDPFR